MSMSPPETTKASPLTIEDFHETDVANDDRRREPRLPSSKTIAIRPCRPDDVRGFRPARLLDCSVHGLGLFADEPMATGEEFLVEFRFGGPLLAVYTVRHCRRAANRYIVGAALAALIGAADEPDADAILRALADASGNGGT